jgi:hypothetical protein
LSKWNVKLLVEKCIKPETIPAVSPIYRLDHHSCIVVVVFPTTAVNNYIIIWYSNLEILDNFIKNFLVK